jgi:hypothetical protein
MKELKFIHITKTAGTSIEDAAKAKGILWGIYHKEYGWHHRIFANVPVEVRDHYDWFMVVRNPYNRVLSEYYCRWGGIGMKNIHHTKAEFNTYLISKIVNEEFIMKFQPEKNGNHFTPQYRYLDADTKIHILKFENIATEFSELMATYGLDIRLQKKNVSQKSKFTVADFSPELLREINRFYAKDFEIFGYSIRTS